MKCILFVLFLAIAYSFRLTPQSRLQSRSSTSRMAFQGITEKMTNIVEFLSGQTKITEKNIEDTLKEVKTILIDADVNLQVTNSLISKVKEKGYFLFLK